MENLFESEWGGLISMFLVVNAAVVIAGFLVTRVANSRQRLKNNGYSEEYATLCRKQSDEAGLWVLFGGMVLQVALSVVFRIITGGLTSLEYARYIIPGSLMLVIPLVGVYLGKKFAGQTKALMEKEGQKVVFDLNYSLYQLIFNPLLEFICAALTAVYALLYLSIGESMLIFLYIILPWFFYLTVRIHRVKTAAALKEQYNLLKKFSPIYQVFLIILIIVETLAYWEEGGGVNWWVTGVLLAILIAKQILYITRYPKLNEGLTRL